MFGVLGGAAILGAFLGWRRGYVTAEFSQAKNEGQISQALNEVAKLYDLKFARNLERLIRLETANFTSKQWTEFNTAGMEAFENNFPYGWSSLDEWAEAMNLPENLFYLGSMRENQTGIEKQFIGFPDPYLFTLFLAWFIQTKRAGQVGKWYSLNNDSAQRYYNLLQDIPATLI